MKKLFIGLAFLGIFTLAVPMAANAESDCTPVTIHCENGNSMTGIICDEDDLTFYLNFYCGRCSQE